MLSKEHVLVAVGLLESFVYSGFVLGWATMNFLLKKEGVFSHLCSDTGQETADNDTVNENYNEVSAFYINNYQYSTLAGNQTGSSSFLSCDEQAKMLNLAYNISVCVGAFTGIFWGILLDKYGIRVLRLAMSLCLSGGAVMLLFTGKDTSWLLFPAMTMCSFCGIPVRLSCLQIAELFPKQRSTLISLYSGANTASAAVFTILKVLYDQGYGWRVTTGVYLGLSLLALPFTFLLFPAIKFDPVKEAVNQNGGVSESVQQLDQNSERPPQAHHDHSPLPLTFSVFSLSSLLYNFWFAWMMLYALYYNGSLHLWVGRFSNNPDDLDTYVNILGLSQLGALVLGPLIGVVIDWNLSRVPEPNKDGPKHPTSVGDGEDFDQCVNQVRATFWMALLTTCMVAAVQITKFFNSSVAIVTSMVFFIIFRSSVMGISITYLRQRFPQQHFNKLVGITATFRSACFLLQFPLFIWDTQQPYEVSTFNMVCLAIAFALPLHLKTPLLPALMRREDKTAWKIYNKESQEIRTASIIATTSL